MNNFNIESHLDKVYAHYPEAPRKPLIGITGNHTDGDVSLREKYYQQVIAAGGTPLVIPPVADSDTLVNILDHLDGLILSGGADYNPLWSGEEPTTGLGHINAQRDLSELLITRLAYNRQLPMLGICRGMQTLAMALGGRVAQDIGELPRIREEMEREAKSQAKGKKPALKAISSLISSHSSPLASQPSPIKHNQDCIQSELTHSVFFEKDSILFDIYQQEKIYVNSFHHQAVADGGKRFRITAQAADGVIEGMESSEFKPILGVQWHPEWLESGLPVFQWLVAQAQLFHQAKLVHHSIVTLDTHCDTPMFFHQGIHFDQRDPRILVDLHKMTEGHQSSVIMAAYLPQPKIGEQFSAIVPLSSLLSPSSSSITPFSYANLIFDHIEDIVKKNSQYISIARTPTDLYEDKRKGRKSIMLAIENGLALNHELANVKHFAQRGVVYMTLCHNGDNDICDSARGCNTHNGVSQFGEKVIQQMNQCGIMVDLSHAGEKSFYNALDISQTPIVCSHSSCRALCDHPRNLTDDQMRALAQAGGVMQVTLYHGFLRQQGEATVMDALQHLEHAIDVMGIDHVGLGTDFDGDGGVCGLADSSEMIQFTQHLLRRKYSLRDIEKIWGANWLRVMAKVQACATTLLMALMFVFSSCKSNNPSTNNTFATSVGPTFVADSAYAYCEAQCAFGPRVMNSDAHDQCGEWIAQKFRSFGCEVNEQKTTLKGYDGTALRSNNIMASLNPNAEQRVLLCAHWDSRPWADNDPDSANWHKPVMAANDGASGVAVMLEVARLLSADDSLSIGVDFVCFDAEDWGTPQWASQGDQSDTWALGAQYWAAQYAAQPEMLPAKPLFGILLDMVGGQGARFYQEGYSLRYAPSTVSLVWQAAQTVGHGSYFPEASSNYITDDHVPVNEVAGIPTIDIIPYYPDCAASSFGPTWHTVVDDMQHIDRTTLQAVGQTVVQVLYSIVK